MKVSLVGCDSYDYDKVYTAVKKSLDNIGGIEKFVKPGDKVFIKLNLLMRKRPEEATTTHPAVAMAVANILLEHGAIVTMGDSPGGLYTEPVLKNLYRVTGMAEVAEKTGVKLNFDVGFQTVSFNDGLVSKAFPIINPILENDVIINLPKLKTHGMTYYTGAVKNLFGTIPGVYKAEYHFKISEKKDFCNMLIDLYECVKPTVNIMDAVYGMEGDGPSGGNPRKIGAVIASENAHALDLVASDIIDIKPDEVFTIQNAIDRKIYSPDDVEIVGGKVEDFKIYDYKMAKGRSIQFEDYVPKIFRKTVKNLVNPRPKFNYDKCIGCGDCARNCPPKAIDMVDSRPKLRLDECIRCFCCQELCPKTAVDIKRNIIMSKLLGG